VSEKAMEHARTRPANKIMNEGDKGEETHEDSDS
jgi:hypothetical protein